MNSTKTLYEIVDYYASEISDGKIEFYQVRNELEQRDLPEENIKFIMKELDRVVRRMDEKNAEKRQAKSLMIVGIITIIFSLGLAGASLLGSYGEGNYFFFIPALGGASIFGLGFKRR